MAAFVRFVQQLHVTAVDLDERDERGFGAPTIGGLATMAVITWVVAVPESVEHERPDRTWNTFEPVPVGIFRVMADCALAVGTRQRAATIWAEMQHFHNVFAITPHEPNLASNLATRRLDTWSAVSSRHRSKHAECVRRGA